MPDLNYARDKNKNQMIVSVLICEFREFKNRRTLRPGWALLAFGLAS